MAFVHPSRRALVPKESTSVRSSGIRLPSPPASPPHSRQSSTNRTRDRSVDDHRRRNEEYKSDHDRGRGGSRDRSRDHKAPYSERDRDDERRRDRGRSRDREEHKDRERRESRHRSNGDRHDGRRDEKNAEDSRSKGGARPQREDRTSVRSPPPPSNSHSGRASPRYDDYSRRDSTPPPPNRDDRYKRPDTPPENAPPWRQQENMYKRDGRLDAGLDYFERRRQQRLNSTLSIWPPSPRAPARGLSLERDSEPRKNRKRDRSASVSSTDSEEDRRRREKKERKRARKGKDRRKRHHRRSQSYSDDDDDNNGARERHRDSRRKRSRSASRERRKTRSRTRSPRRREEESSDEGEWVEKPAPSGVFVPAVPTAIPAPGAPSSSIAPKNALDDDTSDEDVGPQPVLAPSATKKLDERAYGGALLRGEGSAMAAFLQDGTDVRIPRRGEIGLTSDEIDKFESVGYVMSGSRHRRMNAVRMRKENQVISAEEKRGILKLQQEEKHRREAILREEFQELLTERLKGTEGAKNLVIGFGFISICYDSYFISCCMACFLPRI